MNAIVILPLYQSRREKQIIFTTLVDNTNDTLKCNIILKLQPQKLTDDGDILISLLPKESIRKQPFKNVIRFFETIEVMYPNYQLVRKIPREMEIVYEAGNTFGHKLNIVILINTNCYSDKINDLLKLMFHQKFVPLSGIKMFETNNYRSNCLKDLSKTLNSTQYENVTESNFFMFGLSNSRKRRSPFLFNLLQMQSPQQASIADCRTNTPPLNNHSQISLKIQPNEFTHINLKENLFIDKEDGNTRRLKLSLKWSSGQEIAKSDWIQFSSALQFIYTWATYEILINQPPEGYSFQLVATDQCNATASLNLRLTVQNNVLHPPCHQFVLIVESKMDRNTPYIHVLVDLVNLIRVQLNDTNLKNILVTKFSNVVEQKNTFSLSFSDQAIKCQPCDMMAISNKWRISQNTKFIETFAPNFKYLGTTVDKRQCGGNSKPIVLCPIPTLNVTRYLTTKYDLPVNTFYDAEDGFTNSLKLKVSTDGIQNIFMVIIDRMALYIYQVNRSPVISNLRFTLKATDSGGAKTSLEFQIQAHLAFAIPYATFELEFNTFYNREITDGDILLAFLKKLSEYLKIILTIEHISVTYFHRTGLYPQYVRVHWTYFNFFDPGNHLNTFNTINRKLYDGNDISSDFANFMLPYVSDIKGRYTQHQMQTLTVMPTPTMSNQFKTTINSHPPLKTTVLTTIKPSTASLITLSASQPTHRKGPKAMYAIGPFSATFCDFFVYPIPENLFHDINDGNTRNLNLSLQTGSYQVVDKTSWLQIDTDIQVLYGFLKVSDYIKAGGKEEIYYLVARNSLALETYLSFKIKLPEKVPQIFYQITMTVTKFYDSNAPDINEQLLLLLKVSTYFGEPKFSWVNILSFSRNEEQNQVTFAWTNCTLSDSLKCPSTAVKTLSSKVVLNNHIANSKFAHFLAPQYIIKNITASVNQNCKLSTTTSPGTTSTIITTSPLILNRPAALQVYSTSYYRFKIPFNTFFDANDGYTPYLKLAMWNLDGTALSQSSWVQFNMAAQEIYASLHIDVLRGSNTRRFQFILSATNSYKRTTNMIITLDCFRAGVPTGGLNVAITALEYFSSSMNDLQILTLFLQRYFQYMGSRGGMEIKTFQRTSETPGRLSMLFIYNFVNSNQRCNVTRVESVTNKLTYFGHNSNPFLIQVFLPEMTIDKVTVQSFGFCSHVTPPPTPSQGPVIMQHIPLLHASTTSNLQYTIPENSFSDRNDGSTRNLKLLILSQDRTVLSKLSWIQISTQQVLTGVLTQHDLSDSNEKVFQYILRAVNSKGLFVDMIIHISTKNTLTMTAFTFTFTGQYLQSLDTSNVDILIYIHQKLHSYLYGNNPASKTGFTRFNRDQPAPSMFTIKYQDTKITLGNCKTSYFKEVMSKLFTSSIYINPYLILAMHPQISLTSVKMDGQCDQITATATATTTTSITPTPTISPNQPPHVVVEVRPITINYGEAIFYYIDQNTFLDNEDGNTRNLKLELFFIDGQVLSKQSWLQWNQNLQVIYGLLKLSDYIQQPSNGYKYMLVATDSSGLKASTAVTITLPAFNIQYNIRFTMKISQFYDPSLPDVNEQILITRKLFEYIKLYKIQIITFRRIVDKQELEIVWTLYQLPYTPCPVDILREITRKIVLYGVPTLPFTNAMKPEYTLHQISVEFLEPCTFFTQSTSKLSTMTVKPSPSTTTVSPTTFPTRYSPIPINVIPKLNLKQCSKFYYLIPDKAFYDPQDGFTRNLQLNLVNTHNELLNTSVWITLDGNTQAIHAVVPDDILKSQESTATFKLLARNKYGLSAYQFISFQLPSRKQVTHSFSLVFVLKSPLDYDVYVVKLLCQKLNDFMQTTNNVRILRFTRYQSGLMKITWTTCSVETTYCNYKQIRDVKSIFFWENTNVKSDFIQAMHPDVNVGQFSFQLEGPCALSTMIYSTVLKPSPAPTITPPTQNLPPAILKWIPMQNVTSCGMFTYQLPEDAFFDVEDGLTRNLKITIYTQEGYMLPENSWISFNKTTQTFTGVLSDVAGRQEKRFVYKILAVDSGGLAIHQPLQINVIPQRNNAQDIIIDTHGSLYKYTSISQLKILLSKSLSEYFISADPAWYGLKIHSVVVYGTAQKKINFRWSICGFHCGLRDIKKLKSLIFLQGVLKVEFVVLIKPTVIITSVTISNSDTCMLPVSSYSTSSIQLIPSPTPTLNTPPIIYKPVPVLSVRRCTKFEYDIPEKTCFDSQDGYTPKLKVEVQYTNGTSVGDSAWIHLNPSTQKLYGIITESDIESAVNNVLTYLLVCQDNEKASVSQRLHIILDGNSQAPVYSIVMQSYVYTTTHSSYAETQLLWIKKVSQYLGNGTDGKMQIRKFKKSTVLYPQIIISWYFCSINDICSDKQGKKIKVKLFTHENSLNTAFTQAMVPEFVVISGKIQSDRDCGKSFTTSVKPSSSVILTNKQPTALIKTLYVKVNPCSDIWYQIPANTFYDHEDGYTPNLDVKLVNVDGTEVKENSCVKFNKTTQIVYGIIVLENIQKNNKFRLIATDSKGAMASSNISIELVDHFTHLSHVFFARSYLYSSNRNKIRMLAALRSKISAFYGDEGTNTIMIKSARIEDNYIDIEWSNCSLVSTCNVDKIKTIQSKILYYNKIINAEFIASLAPTFIVTFVQFSYGVTCSSVISVIISTSPTSISRISTTSVILPTPTPIKNTPPVVSKPLVFIDVPLCSSFSYRIPADTFFDREDGFTRYLSLDLLTFDGRELPKTSWVLFVSSTQVIYGHPRVNDMKATKSYLNYLLRATDYEGTSVTTVLTLMLPPKPVINFQLNVTVRRFFDYQTPDLTAQLFLVSKICSYIGDRDVTKVLVLSFERTEEEVTLSWTNCTLRNQCKKEVVAMLVNMFITDGRPNDSFQEVLKPYYHVKNVTGDVANQCTQGSSTQYMSITPTKSLSLMPTPTVKVNYPPRIQNIIPPIEITFCKSFAYHIPENIFIDEDGTTSTLSLNLFDINGTVLSKTSWIQFNSNLQVAYGLLKTSDILRQPRNGFRFLLQGTDSKNLSATTILPFQELTDSTVIGVLVEMKIRCSLVDGYPYVNDLFQIINKISQYFNDKSPANVKSIDFKETRLDAGLILFTWTNCSFDFTTCPENDLHFFESMLLESDGNVKAAFKNTFLPQYTLEDLKIVRKPPCTTSSTAHPITPSPSPSDKPLINRYIPPLTIRKCSHLSYQIPPDTFYDYKDGYTRRLKLTLRFINGESILDSFWLQFDQKKQVITGLPVKIKNNMVPPNGYLFTLTATDNDGYSVSMNIQVNVEDNDYPILQNITLHLTLNFDLRLPNHTLERLIVRRIAKFYNDVNERYIDIIEFRKDGMFVSIGWSNCTLNSGKCDKNLASWMQNFIMDEKGECRAQFSFVFLPEFSVQDLTIKNDKSCINESQVTILPTLSSQILPSSSIVVPDTIRSLYNISIDVSYCGSIKHTIPNGIFYDSYDGNEQSLMYSLLYTDGFPISCNSWIQLDSNKIIGIPTQSQPNSPNKYLLRAANALGSSARTFVSLNLDNKVPNVTYKVALSFKTTFGKTVCDAQVIQTLIDKIVVYFKKKDDRNINVLYFSRGDVTTPSYIMWSNCSLRTEICDFVNINRISEMLYNGTTSNPNDDLTNVLLPEFYNVSVLDEKSGPCSKNKVLAVGKHPETLCANSCGLFSYTIPDETFVDPEEGNTPNLIVEVVQGDRSPLPADLWLQYNMTSKTLYGMPTEVVKRNQPKNGYRYLLIAYDTGGAAAETVLQIKICGETPSYKNSVTLSFTCVNNLTSVITTVINILKNISDKYSDGTLNSTFLVKYESNHNKLNITWANCSSDKVGLKNQESSYQVSLECSNNNVIFHRDFPPIANTSNIRVSPSYRKMNVYDFPRDAFYDKEDGSMANLNLYFTYANGTVAHDDHWVGFVREKSQIYIIPTNKTKNNLVYQYLFVAKDSSNQTANISLYVEMFESFPTLNFIVHAQYKSYYNAPTVAKIYTFLIKMNSFLGVNSTLVVSDYKTFQNNSIMVEYGNYSLSRMQCDYEEIESITTRLISSNGQINADLFTFMFPECLIEKIRTKKLEICLLPQNKPPMLINPIPDIDVPSCGYLTYKIPNTTFYDAEDGWTGNLTLTLERNRNCWLEFDKTSQTLYGMVSKEAIANMPVAGYRITITAVDSRGSMVNTTVNVTVSQYMQSSFELVVLFETAPSLNLSCLKEKILVLEKFKSYLQDANSLTIKSVVKGTDSVIMEVIVMNCSMRYQPCDYISMDGMLNQLEDSTGTVKREFYNHMLPQFIPRYLSKRRDTPCLDSSNKKPKQNIAFVLPNLTSCDEFRTKLPSNFITDAEDGPLEKLKVTLLNASNGFEVQNASWIYLDRVSKILTIASSYEVAVQQPIDGYKFTIIATDSRLASASVTFFLKFDVASRNSSFVVSENITLESKKSVATWLFDWKNKTERAINQPIEILSYKIMKKEVSTVIKVLWTTCDDNRSGNFCNFLIIDKIKYEYRKSDTIFDMQRYGPCLNKPLYPPNATKNNIVYINPCLKLSYRLPHDMFADEKDGGTSNLTVTLKQTYPTAKINFLFYNASSQTLQGVVIVKAFKEYTYIEYEAIATDSDNLQARTSVKFMLDKSYVRQYQVTTDVLYFPGVNSKETFIEYFFDKVESYLKLAKDGIIIYSRNKSKTASQNTRFNVTFTPCSLTGYGCNNEEFTRVQSLLVLPTGKPKFDFVSSLLDIVVTREVNIKQLQACNDTRPTIGTVIGQLKTSICNHLTYKIPDSAFLDAEQGSTSNLHLQFRNLNEFDWIQFNETMQILKARPTLQTIIDQPSNGYGLILVAIDVAGNTVSQNITLLVKGDLRAYNFFMQVTLKPLNYKPINNFILHGKLDEKLKSITDNEHITIANLTYVVDSIYVDVYDCNLKEEFCQVKQNEDLLGFLLSNTSVIKTAAMNNFLPEFQLLKVEALNMNKCKNISSEIPFITDAIPELHMDFCQQLNYNLPDGLFMDSRDGELTGTSIEFCYQNGTVVGKTSLSQYDQGSRIISGYLTQNDLIKYGLASKITFILKATDSDNNSIDTFVYVTLPQRIINNYIISLKATTYLGHTLSDLDIIANFRSRMYRYFKDSTRNTISIIRFSRNGFLPQNVDLQWTNCTVTGDNCDEKKIDYIYNKIYVLPDVYNPYYVDALGRFEAIQGSEKKPGFTSSETGIAKDNICLDPNNTKPVSTRNITINITQCCAFNYVLANDTFLDIEDGGINKMEIKLKFTTGENIPSQYWIQYNDTKKTLYGYPNDDAFSVETRLYVLQATDSGGRRALTYIIILLNRTDSNSVGKRKVIKATASCKENQDVPLIGTIIDIIEYIASTLQVNKNDIHLSSYAKRISNINIVFYTCSDTNLANISIVLNKTVKECLITDIVIDQVLKTTAITPTPTRSIQVSSSVTAPIVQVPRVINSIPVITITCGIPLRYVIGENTFYDEQDGTTSNLNLTILDQDRRELRKSYVQFYMETKDFFFFVSVDNCHKVVTDKVLFVKAIDRDGNFVMDSFSLLEIKETVSCCMYIKTTNNISYENVSHNNKYIYNYYKTLQSAPIHNDVKDELRIVSVVETDEKQTGITYTNKTFTNKTCFENITSELYDVVFDSNNGTILESYKQKLKPFFLITADTITNQRCNDTNLTIIVPFVPPPSVGRFTSSEDWFLYMLPLFILAFMLLAICLCFYICRCCYRCCCGVNKEKPQVYHVDNFDQADGPLAFAKAYESIPEDIVSVTPVFGDVKPMAKQSWDVSPDPVEGGVLPLAKDDPEKPISSIIAPIQMQEAQEGRSSSMFAPLLENENQGSRSPSNMMSVQSSRRPSHISELYAQPIKRNKKIFQTSRNRSLRSLRRKKELHVSAPVTTSYTTHGIDHDTQHNSHMRSVHQSNSSRSLRHRHDDHATRRHLRLPAIPTGPPPPYSPPRKARIVRKTLFPEYYERYVQPSHHRHSSAPIAIPLKPTIIKSARRSVLLPRLHKRRKVVSMPLIRKHRKHKEEKPIEVIELADSASEISTSASSTLRKYDSESSIEVKAILKGKGKAIRKILGKPSPISYLNTKVKHKSKHKRQEKYRVNLEKVALPKKTRLLPGVDIGEIEVRRRHHPYQPYEYKFTEPYLYDYIPIRRKKLKRNSGVRMEDKINYSEDEEEIRRIRSRLTESKHRPTLDELLEETDKEDTLVRGKRRLLPLKNRKNKGNESIREQRRHKDKETWISLEDLNPEV